MFYKCPKCKRKWQYPLAECPYCFAPLVKMESRTATVISVAKVGIPTLFHPNVPYYLLLLEDENKNIWAQKSEKEFQPGETFESAPDSSKSSVAIWRVKYDIEEAIEKVLELVGDAKMGANSKILVLPTLAKPSHSYFCDNSSPRFFEAVLKILISRGVKTENITVASQSFDDAPIGAAAQKSGLLAICAKYNITPVDLATAAFEKVGQLEVSKAAIEADLVVNLAIEKMGQASATANVFKVLRKENFLGQKYLSSEKEIAAALDEIIGNAITVAEAENIQRSNKLTTYVGLVMASRSSRNLDRVFGEITQSFKVPEILKEITISDIPVNGRSIKEVQYCAEIF